MTAPDETPTDQRIWKPPLGRLTFGLVTLVVAIAFEALAVATSMPATVRELGGLEFYGWSFSAFLLTNLVGITVGGGESDRLGPASVIGRGVALFAFGLGLSGFAGTMPLLVLGRAIQGFGGGMLLSAGYAAIACAYRPETQPRVLAVLSSAWVVPGLVGPGIAGLVTEYASWRWVFWGLVPLPLLATALVLPGLRGVAVGPSADASANSDPRGPRGRMLRSLELGVGAGLALLGLDLGSRPLMLLAIVVGSALTIDALRALWPAGTLLARRGQPAAIACLALLNFAYFGAETFLPLAIDRVRGADVFWTGASLTAAAITWTLGSWIPVRLGGAVRRRSLVAIGVALLVLSFVGVLAILSPKVPLPTILASWTLAGLGIGLAYSSLSAAILGTADEGRAGEAAASLQLAQVLGAALATGWGGAIVAAPFAGDPPTRGIAVIDLGTILALLATAALSARLDPPPEERP